MGIILKLRKVINKRNGQINFSVPKKELDVDIRKKLLNCKRAIISLDGFEE